MVRAGRPGQWQGRRGGQRLDRGRCRYGGRTDVTYRTYDDRALLHVFGDVWQNPGTWRPRVVVVNLGTNDFSTAVNPGEPRTPGSLAAAYRSA